jgi:hypothetical protein
MKRSLEGAKRLVPAGEFHVAAIGYRDRFAFVQARADRLRREAPFRRLFQSCIADFLKVPIAIGGLVHRCYAASWNLSSCPVRSKTEIGRARPGEEKRRCRVVYAGARENW